MKAEKISLWRERIANKKASGMKLVDWCTQNQLTKHTYYYWQRKITDLDLSESDRPVFIEIPSGTEDTAKSASRTLLIEWKDISIQITDSDSVNLAAELLARLQKLC